MLSETELRRMYHIWQQGDEYYVYHWIEFVEHAAKQFNTTGDEVMRILQKCYWFRKGE